MLEVRCGTADKSHENSFFRYFASQLKNHFDCTGRDGILVGMPECKVRDNLQIDALLITDSSLTIIDFKDYDDCEVYLPDEADFDRGRWDTDKDYYVKGGSSRNPYSQLMRQRGWLKEILDRSCRHKLAEFDASHITAMVCFSGKVTLSGSIPGSVRLKFFVSDSDSFLERIHDITNVRSVGLLGSEFVSRMFDMLFDAQPYECDLRPSESFVREADQEPIVESLEEHPDEDSAENRAAIREFFEGDGDVLILSSIDPAERASLAVAAREDALAAGFGEALLLTSTKLAKDRLCAGQPIDGSLYSEIYDFSSRHISGDGIDLIDLGDLKSRLASKFTDDSGLGLPERNQDSNGAPGDRIAFIVCEGQLVSSVPWLDGAVVFGSGKLLSDTLEYLEIAGESTRGNKIVVIGDDCQIGSGARNQSSMHEEAYPEGVKVSKHSLPIREPEDARSEFLNRIAECIRTGDYSLIAPDIHAGNPRIVAKAEERVLLEDVEKNWRTHKILSYTNGQANQLNLFIKKAITHSGERLGIGDVLLFNNQFVAISCDPFAGDSPTRTVKNGEFARVTYVGDVVMSIGAEKTDGGEPETVTIAPFRFVPEGSREEFESWLALEYLYSLKAELSPAQELAIKVELEKMERAERAKHPFGPGNKWYEEMVADGNYVETADKTGTIEYRLGSDRRRLTPQEKEYRKEIRWQLNTPGSVYFFLSNLSKARFGWAVTTHKSQSFQWDMVTLSVNAGMGKHSEGFFRFLYTGASRAQEQLNIVRWEEVTPFDGTVFDETPSNVRKKAKKSVLFKASHSSTIAQQIADFVGGANLPSIEVLHTASSKWREAFTFSREESESVVAFDYNKSNEVFMPRLERGDSDLFAAVMEALSETESGAVRVSPMAPAYQYVEGVQGGRVSIAVMRSDRYRDEIRVELDGSSFYAVVHYGDSKIVSRIEFQSGDSNAFSAFGRLVNPAGTPGSR